MATRKQYIDYMGTLKGGYGPAKGLKNNDNQFNTWYYGRRVSGDNYAWCAVAECYVENHFGILAVNGGKVAYVPNMVSVGTHAGAKIWRRPSSVPAQGTSWAQPGNKIVYAFTSGSSGSHTGTFVRRLSATTFLSREGNTSTSQYSDAFADKERSVHNVLAVVELLGVDGNDTEDDMQPKDKLPVGAWMKQHWSKDKGITDGTMLVETTLTSGYGHSRAAHENTDNLVQMVTALQITVATLAATVADMDARIKAG